MNIEPKYYGITTARGINSLVEVFGQDNQTFDTFEQLMDYVLTIPNTWCYLYHYKLNKYGILFKQYLDSKGFEYVDKQKNRLCEKEYTILVFGGKWYYICFKYNKHTKVIYDASKLLPSISCEEIAEAFNCKGNEAEVVAIALKELSEFVSINNSTLSKAVFGELIDSFCEKGEKYIPSVSYPKKWVKRYSSKLTYEQDSELRPALKGGAIYCKPGYYTNITKIDVNSMYPNILRNELLPYGQPYESTEVKTLEDLNRFPFRKCCIIKFRCIAKIKSNRIPVLCRQEVSSIDGRVELVKECDDTDTWMLTNLTFDLFLKNYKYKDLEIIKVIGFKADKGAFKSIVDKYYDLKIKYTLENNAGKRLIVKICLNTIWGRFGLKRSIIFQRVEIVDGMTKLINNVEKLNDGVYLPLAIFVADWAKYKIITAAQTIGEKNVVAMDTDCLQFVNLKELPPEIEVDDTKLGAFKLEGFAEEGKYLGARAYMLMCQGKPVVRYSGLDLSARNTLLTIDDFEVGKQIKINRLSVINGKEIWKEGQITIGGSV